MHYSKTNNFNRIISFIIATIMVVTMLPLNTFAAGDTSYASTEKIKSNLWPVRGGENYLIKNYSGSYQNFMGSTGMRYLATGRDSQGEYLEVEVTQVGKVYDEGQSLALLTTSRGWSHLVVHFDKILFNNLELDKSSITGPNGTFYLSNRLKGNSDVYKSDDYSVSIPLVSIFDKNYTSQKGQRAILKLYLKDGHNLINRENYLIEYRIMGRNTTGGIYTRQYILGITDQRPKEFDEPFYLTHTKSLSVPYQAVVEDVKYTSYGQDIMSNAYTSVYIDWNTNELHVNYLYETYQANNNANRTQFIQLFPAKLKYVLSPRNGVYAKFNHVYKRADIGWAGDEGINLYRESFASEKDGVSGYRLRMPSANGSNYNHPWTWVTETTNDGQGSTLGSVRGRFMSYSRTEGVITNHTIYYIDPDKFIDTFDSLDDLKFSSFFVSKDNRESVGGVIKNSESIESLGVTKILTDSPQINDIYTDSNIITGDTGYSGGNVSVAIKNFKNNSKSKIIKADNSGKLFITANEHDVFDNMLKDEKLSFETIYRYANYHRSRPTIEKVKARITFNGHKEVFKVLDVPASDKFRGEEGYKENGMGSSMLQETPTREGYKFAGWSTKPTKKAYKDLKDLTDVSEWNFGEAFKFDANTPIDKSYTVYPVWEVENKGITVVLHSNYDDRTKEIEIAYDENLPLKSIFNSSTTLKQQYDAIATGNYSKYSKLPNAYVLEYQTEALDNAIFGIKTIGDEKYNMVGWSTTSENDNILIEDLISNLAIIAKEGTGKDTEYYFSTVRSVAQGIGQAAAAKQFIKLTPDDENKIHLYAAWKPYFDITLTKSWYDATNSNSNKSIKEMLQEIAHKSPTAPKQEPSLAKPIQVGLLNRTAVTEANDPTVTDKANYYIVSNSLQDLPANGGPLTWKVPSYDMYGKRLSYIAVEFEQGQSGKDKYNEFNNSWTNIWTSVGNNLGPGEHNWDNTTISKVQSLVIPSANGDVDAYAGATVRKLIEDGVEVTAKSENKSIVSSKPKYNTSLYNLKTKLNHPTFKAVFNGDKEIKLVKSDDTRVQVVEFDLPEVSELIYFKKNGNSWKRVLQDNDKWKDYEGTNNYVFEENEKGEWVLKLDLVGKNRYKYLKTGQTITATYYGAVQAVQSLPSVTEVIEKPKTPTLEGLEQQKLEKKGNEEFVVIRSLIPTDDLGQFQAGAKITLFDADANNGEELSKAYKNLDGSNVTATREGAYFVFRVPKSVNPNLKHETNVAAFGEQDNFIPTRTRVPLKLDLMGPVVTAEETTVYLKEDIEILSAIQTDEDAELIEYPVALPGTLKLSKREATLLARNWKLEGNSGDVEVTNTIDLTYADKYGNESKSTWKLNVIKKPVTDSIENAKQLKNRIDADYLNYSYIVKADGLIEGSTVKVYLSNPELRKTYPIITSVANSSTMEIEIPQGIGNNIKDFIYITQTEENKNESKALEVSMDVVPPLKPFVEKLVPGEVEMILQLNNDLSGKVDDATKLVLQVGNQRVILTRDENNVDTWEYENGRQVQVEDNKLSVQFNKKLNPFEDVKIIALDDILNPQRSTLRVKDYELPDSPSIVAENKNSTSTTVTGASNPDYVGATIKIYELVTVKDEESEDEIQIRKLVGMTVVEKAEEDENGNKKSSYKYFITPKMPVGTKLGATVEVNGKESRISETFVVENANIIPFDPTDENIMPNPDENRYVTVTLDANGGTFENGTKSSYYVLKDYVVKSTDFENARLRLEPPINKAFDRWSSDKLGNNAFPEEGMTFNASATVYAQYKDNDNIIPFNPEDPAKPSNPDPSKYVTISLNANGGSFKPGTKSSFYVKKAYTLSTRDFIDAQNNIIPPVDKAFNTWTLDEEGVNEFPAAGKKFDIDSIVYAQYREGRDVIPKTGNEKPDGYVTVYFTSDDAQASLKGETVFYVNPKAMVKLGGINAPTILPKTGYAVSYPAWIYSDELNASSPVVKDVTSKASLYDKDKVIPVQEGVNVSKPDGYLDIIFSHGENGKLEGTSKYYVKPGTESKDVPTPTIIPNLGYKVANPQWNNEIPEKYNTDFTTTAQYSELPDISDEPQSGYVMILFEAGLNGKLEEDVNKKSIIFVNPNKLIALQDKAPNVIADINYSFDSWTIENEKVDLSQPKIYFNNTIIKASYLSDISDESKDGFTLVTFKAGANGIIETGNANLYVKIGKEVDLTSKAPLIKPNDGYTHTGWDKPLRNTFSEATDINAIYSNPNDISVTPVEGYKLVEFIDGNNIKIAEKAVKKYWVNPNKVVSVPAPDVVVVGQFTHIGWSTSLTQQFTVDTKISPSEMESTDISVTKIDTYTEIKFTTANRGKILGTSDTTYSIWVNPTKEVTIQPPQVDANQGLILKSWKNTRTSEELEIGKLIKGTFPFESSPVTFQAQYSQLDDISDTPHKGFVAITFRAGEYAKFVGKDINIREITYYVNPKVGKSLNELFNNEFKEPDLEYYPGYQIKDGMKWNPLLDKDLPVTAPATYDANVESKGTTGTEEPKDWKKVEFRIFEYDKNYATITGRTIYRVDPKLNVRLRAPIVTVTKDGYSHDGWSHSLTGTFTQDTIIYALIGGDISTTEKDGFVKVTFEPGNNGRFEGENTKTIFVRKNKIVDLTAWAPKVIPNQNYSHEGWLVGNDKYLKENFKLKFTENENIITASYFQDIIEDSEDPVPPNGYVSVDFYTNPEGKFETDAKTNFYVRVAAKIKLGELNQPKPIPNEGYFFIQWKENNENPVDNNTIIDREMQLFAEYSKDVIPGNNPNKPIPDGFVRITFDAGLYGKFKLNQNTFYDVRVEANKVLSDIGKPEVEAFSGYTHTGWDKADNTRLNSNMTVTAKYKPNTKDVVNPNLPIEEGYVRVEFNPTNKGIIVSGKQYQDVLIVANKLLGDLDKPHVVGVNGNIFEKWDKDNSIPIDSSIPNSRLVVTAEYNEDIKIVDDVNSEIPSGYARVVFNKGANGEFTPNSIKAYDILIKETTRTLKDVEKPGIVANVGYTFDQWDKGDSYELVINTRTDVTALYKKNVKVTDDESEPIEEGYVRASFKTDSRGSLIAEVNGVLKDNLDAVYIDVIKSSTTVGAIKNLVTVNPHGENKFKNWSLPDNFVIVNKTDINAEYLEGQTGMPTAIARNIRADNFTTITGKAEPNATVIAKVKGVVVGQATANDNGEYTIETATKLLPRTEVLVTATKSPKTVSEENKTFVFTDLDGDGNPDGDLEAPKKPIVDQPRTEDESITMKVPTENDANKITVVINDKNDNFITKVEVNKDGENWKIGDTVLEVGENDKITIPLPGNTTLYKDDKVTVVTTDTSGNESEPYNGTVLDKDTLKEPLINTPKQNDVMVTGTAEGATHVDVEIIDVDNSTIQTIPDQVVNSNGEFTVRVDALKDGQKVKVTAKASGYNPSTTTRKVGLELEKIKNTVQDANDYISNAENDSNWNPTGADANPFDEKLKEKLDKANEVIANAEDVIDNNDPTQAEVDKAEEELRDALNKKDADTKVSIVEDIVKEGNKPTPNDIKTAQDAIDKIDGSIDPTAEDFDSEKKELQDRLDKAKALDELKDAKEKLDEAIKNAEDENKPKEIVDEAKEKSEAAKDIIDNSDDKTPEDVVEIIKEVKTITETLGKPVIQIFLSKTTTKDNQIVINTNPGGCMVEIEIISSDGTSYTIESKTGPAGSGIVSLRKPLVSDDVIIIKATKKSNNAVVSDYIDNSIVIVI